MQCRVRLLGELAVDHDGLPLPRVSTRKSAELLALLGVKFGAWRSREELAQCLWPASEPELARTSLRQALAKLREALGPAGHILESDKVAVRLDPELCTCDLSDFASLVNRSSSESGDQAIATLRAAIAIGEHELVPSVRTEWIEPIRLDHAETCLGLRETLVESLGNLEKWAEALAEAETAVNADPLRESFTLWAMRCAAKCGERNRGLVAFRKLERRSIAELGLPPSEALRIAAAKLRRASLRSSVGPSAPMEPPALPSQPWATIGREEDVHAIASLLLEPRSHVTVTGLGGIGKSQVARDVVAAWAAKHEGPVWTVVLEPGQSFVSRFARELGLGTEAETLSEAVASLPRKRSLVFLDNAEDFIDSANELAVLLGESLPEASLLVTSRAPSAPGIGIEFQLAPVAPDPAMHLFLAGASRAVPSRVVGFDEAAVRAVCETLDGIPLAILVAASQTRVQSPGEMAEALTAKASIPALERCIRWSLERLGSIVPIVEQLAVFRGGWNLARLSDIRPDDNPVETMDRLLTSGLVTVTTEEPARRFELLSTVRQTVLSNMDEGRLHDFREVHATVFEAFSARLASQYFSGEQATAGQSFEPEGDNVRAAVEYLLEAETPRAARMALNCAPFWFALRQTLMAERLFEDLLARDLSELTSSEIGLVKQRAAINCGRHGNYSRALSLLTEARDAYTRAGDRIRLAEALNSTGNIHLYVGGGLAESETCFREALGIFESENYPRGRAMVMGNLGKALRLQNRLGEATEALTRALAMNRASHHEHWEVSNLSELGEIALRQGQFLLARERLVEAEALSAKLQGSSLMDITVSQAELAVRTSDTETAWTKALFAVQSGRQAHFVSYLPEILRVVVFALSESGHSLEASRVAGIEESCRASHGLSLAGEPAERYGNLLTTLSARYGDAFHEQFLIGSSWSQKSGLDWLEDRLRQALVSPGSVSRGRTSRRV